MYEYGTIKVEDYFEDHLDEDGKAFFKRTLTFTTEKNKEPFFFRLGAGKIIERNQNSWKIDRLNLGIDQNLKPIVREGDPKDLILPIKLSKGETKIRINYKW